MIDDTTKERYLAWMGQSVPDDGYGFCQEVSKAMVKDFPELEVRYGFYYASAPWGRRQHWWCRVKGTDTIVDPTALQHPCGQRFPDAATSVRYEDLTDLSPEELAQRVPTGRCMDCGDDVYEGKTFCDAQCEANTRAYLGI